MEKLIELPLHVPNHSHAWRGSWNRPMFIDEAFEHPFTVARMTDHNVRGPDKEEAKIQDEVKPKNLEVAPALTPLETPAAT